MEVRDELDVRDSGLLVVEVGGGWQMVTRPQYAPGSVVSYRRPPPGSRARGSDARDCCVSTADNPRGGGANPGR